MLAKILYEDELCIVFNKPSGILVIPSPKQKDNTLVDIVNDHYKNRLAQNPDKIQKDCSLHPCHRLDKDTSGVILFAKGKANQKRLMALFEARQVKKEYLAFVHGKLKVSGGELKSRIKDYYQKKFNNKSKAPLAITRFKVLQQKKNYCIVEVIPVTGRTNQIRIQFAEKGHALVGENRYAFRRDFALRFKRTALHAQSLQWKDPASKKVIKVEAPLAKDMENFLNRKEKS